MKFKRNHYFSTAVEIIIPFHDADPMGFVWHGNYFRYLEIAREKLLQKFDYGYQQMHQSNYVWPVIEAQIKYIAPIAFDQQIKVFVQMEEYQHRLRFSYYITDAKSKKKLTTAQTTQVPVNISTREMSHASPEVFLNKINKILSLSASERILQTEDEIQQENISPITTEE